MRYAAAIVSFVLGSVLLSSSFETHGPQRPSNDASLRTVDDVSTIAAPTSLLVMTFIDPSDPDTPGANRSQAVVARSIHDQYEQRGIRVIVVQSSAGRRAGQDPEAQMNVRYDWGLAQMTIIPDLDGRLAQAYAVREFPTTMVLGDLGDPIAVWEGYSPPSVLGPALERIATTSLNPGR